MIAAVSVICFFVATVLLFRLAVKCHRAIVLWCVYIRVRVFSYALNSMDRVACLPQ